MLEELTQCPLCNGGHFHSYLSCKDHTVSKEYFNIVQCDNCEFLFTNPRPTPENLGRYYQSEEYISHSNKSNSIVNVIYKLARNFTISSKLKLISKYSSQGSVLDIGCGTGHFIEACRKSGWTVTGVEPDQNAALIAKEKVDNQIYPSTTELPEGQYNIITMWHVLEHIPDIDALMKKLSRILSKSGTLIIAVPNHKSYDAQRYQEYWAAYDVPRHLYHFDQKTLSHLMTKYQLQVRKILPMKLDAFYVSLLSETYRGQGLKKYTNSILNGYKSNTYAKNNDKNYSSLIYIIKRQ